MIRKMLCKYYIYKLEPNNLIMSEIDGQIGLLKKALDTQEGTQIGGH